MADNMETLAELDGRTQAADLVQNYLDALLREIPAEIVLEPQPQPDPSPEPQLAQQPEQQPLTNKRDIPDWAQGGFSSLLFDVAGLKLAAPLHELGGITLIEDRLQTMAGQAGWFMGLLRWNGRNLRVVDTAGLLMPERLSGDSHRASYQSVVVLGDSHWALAVDSADESLNLKLDEIRWKFTLGNRPWLAGTLLNRLCALLDVQRLLEMLQHEDSSVDDLVRTEDP